MNNLLVVGMQPASDAIYVVPRRNTTFWNLELWLRRAGIERFSFVNAVHRPGPCTMHDVDWLILLGCCRHHEKVCGLGSFVHRALDRAGVGHYPFPHPSPRNRVWNDHTMIDRHVKALREYYNNVPT